MESGNNYFFMVVGFNWVIEVFGVKKAFIVVELNTPLLHERVGK